MPTMVSCTLLIACYGYIPPSNLTADHRIRTQMPIEDPSTTDTGFMTIQTSVRIRQRKNR